MDGTFPVGTSWSGYFCLWLGRAVRCTATYLSLRGQFAAEFSKATAPDMFTQHARNPENSVVIGGNNSFEQWSSEGGLGFRTGTALCFAMVSKPRDWKVAGLISESYEIEVAGARFDMKALAKAPYDPERLRLHG